LAEDLPEPLAHQGSDNGKLLAWKENDDQMPLLSGALWSHVTEFDNKIYQNVDKVYYLSAFPSLRIV